MCLDRKPSQLVLKIYFKRGLWGNLVVTDFRPKLSLTFYQNDVLTKRLLRCFKRALWGNPVVTVFYPKLAAQSSYSPRLQQTFKQGGSFPESCDLISLPFRSVSLLCKSNRIPRTRLSTSQTGEKFSMSTIWIIKDMSSTSETVGIHSGLLAISMLWGIIGARLGH